MIHRKSILGGIVNPFQHVGMIYYQRYEARGNAMPFTIFFGGCPSAAMIGSMNVPAGVSEAEIAGGLRRAPLSLVKCETNDLLVPATAEIVIEGHVRPYERWDEGPFGEATGYRASPRMPRPVFRVDCITHRNNPIMPISCPGVELDECEILFGVYRDLRKAGLPVRAVLAPPGLKFSLLLIVVEKGHAGIADAVTSVVRASKGGVNFQYIMVTDEAVDATNMTEFMHAAFTKAHPISSIQIMNLSPGHPLIPFSDLHDKMHARGASLTWDATTPVEQIANRSAPQRVSFEDAVPADVQSRVSGLLKTMGVTSA
jgi:4-hydroxy-3-polyprenylbenzoate decarboxylase